MSEADNVQGTRVHIYRWLNSAKARDKATQAQLNTLPVIETKKKWTKKIHPGALTVSGRSARCKPY